MGVILRAAACRRSAHSTVVTSNICEGRDTGVPALRFVFSFLICSEACDDSHMGRANYISASGCSIPYEILYPFSTSSQGLQKPGQRVWGWTHGGIPACTESQEETTTLWTYLKGWKNPKLFYSLNLFTWAQVSHCTVQEKHKHTRTTAAVKLSTSASSNSDWFKTPALRPAVTRHSSGGETRDTLEKHLLAVPVEVLLPTETLSLLCCSSTIITPPSAVLLCPSLIRPGAALPAVSDLALPHNPQELILPDLNRP